MVDVIKFDMLYQHASISHRNLTFWQGVQSMKTHSSQQKNVTLVAISIIRE